MADADFSSFFGVILLEKSSLTNMHIQIRTAYLSSNGFVCYHVGRDDTGCFDE